MIMSVNCTKDFAITVETGVQILSYWKFDELAGPRADSHGSNHLSIAGNGCSSGAGIINNAAVFDLGTPFPVDGLNRYPGVTGLDFDTVNGMTFAGWFFVTTYNPFQSASMFVLSSDNNWNLSIIKAVGNQITFNLGADAAIDNIQLYGAGPFDVWIFVRAWLSPVDRLIHAKINEGTEIVGVVPYDPGFVPLGNAGLFCQSTTPWVWRNDEWGIWRGVMTDAQGAFLYNSGAGRTYPDIPGL